MARLSAAPSRNWQAAQTTVTRQPRPGILPGSGYGSFWKRPRGAPSQIITPPEAPPSAGPPVYESTGTYGQSAGAAPAATVSCGVPSGVVADDIIELRLFVDVPTTTITPPAGFAEAPSSPASITTGGNQKQAVYWKRSTGSEPGSYVTSFSPDAFAECVAIRVSNCITSGSPYDDTDSAVDTGFPTTSPAVSVTTTGADRLLVHSATNWSGGAWTPSSGFTTRASGGFNVLHVATKTQTAAGSSGTVQATCTAGDRQTAWLGALIGTTPAGGGTTPVGPTDLTTSWRVLAQITSDLATSWRVAAQVTSDLFTSWRVYAPVGQTDLITSWRVYAPVGASDLATSWRVLARVTADLLTSWRVAAAVGPTDLATSWKVYVPVGASDLLTSWRVLSSLTPVTSDLVTSWRVLGRVTSDLATSWRVRALVTSDLVISWRVYVPVGPADLATSWRVLQQVLPVGPSDLATSWRVYALVGPTDLVTSWRVLIAPLVPRPGTGTVARPNTGTVARPGASLVARPSADMVARANAGTVPRP